jgi:hypothetical protein
MLQLSQFAFTTWLSFQNWKQKFLRLANYYVENLLQGQLGYCLKIDN